jgi:hypothetical protein
MSGPVLDLRPDCLASPTRLDIALVEVMMLWPRPTDELWRSKVYSSIEVHDLLGRDQYPGSQRQLQDVLAKLPSLVECRSASEAAQANGSMAGEYLLHELGVWVDRAGRDGKGYREHLARSFKAPIVKGYKARRLSGKTLENQIWRTFRSVAPFWGATRLIAWETFLASGRPGAFPCVVENFIRFLVYANELRRRGESHRPRQSRWPQLLPPAEMVRIPDHLGLPQTSPLWWMPPT